MRFPYPGGPSFLILGRIHSCYYRLLERVPAVDLLAHTFCSSTISERVRAGGSEERKGKVTIKSSSARPRVTLKKKKKIEEK